MPDLRIVKVFMFRFLCLLFLIGSFNVYGADGEDVSSEQSGAYDIVETFDIASGMYIEKIDTGVEFISSVPNGAVVSDGVYFEIPADIVVNLQKDGDSCTFNNKTAITGAGYYIMKLSAVNTLGQEINGVFTFRITAPPTGKINTGEYKYGKINCTPAITSDAVTGLYKYTLPNYKSFFTDIEQYGQSVESARFIIPRNLGYSLQKDGNSITLLNNKVYRESGNYTLKIFGYSYAQSGGYEACYETVLNFTIPAPVQYDIQVENDISLQETQLNIPTEEQPEKELIAEREMIDDSLLESYFESANIYSETFSTGDAFYTNTPNNGIVGGNVYFDIPYNMSVSMTKDGIPVEFRNKTYINEPGSYLMLITDVYDGSTSTASFSFRIQNGVAELKNIMSEENTESESQREESETNRGNSDGEKSESTVRYDVKNSYDSDMGMYVFDCGDEVFYASVPDGMFSNSAVTLNVPGGLEKVLTKDGEEIEYTDHLTEDGRYELSVKSDGDEVSVSFDIAAYSVNYMREFTVPEGYEFVFVEYSDFKNTYSGLSSEDEQEYEEKLLNIETQQYSLPDIFELQLDGQYDFLMQGKRGMPILSVTIMLDTTAPVIRFDGIGENMRTDNNSVTIYCEDTEAVIMLRDSDNNEEQITTVDGSAVIEGEGKYSIVVSDAAGNENEYTFVLGNAGLSWSVIILSILAAVLVIAIVGVIIIKKSFMPSNKAEDSKNNSSKHDKNGLQDNQPESDGENDDWEDSTRMYADSDTSTSDDELDW